MPLQYLQELRQAFNAKPSDLKKCTDLLLKLKLLLVEQNLLFPQENVPKDKLREAREVLEIGAFVSIRSRDLPAFDRYFAQLQTFYTDFVELERSEREYPIRGLNLIHLLTQNRIADFHITLESLDAEAILDNEYIKHPVNLERWLMEGSYSKVWNAREEAPAEEYKFFVNSLVGTIRNEIASCQETAYESLPLKDAATLLFFTNQSELLTFAQARAWEVNLSAGTIIFKRKDEEKMEIPKQRLISASLAYARELEQII
ncbi:26S proteasome non-ATPase regulatory subunit 8 [Psilocybe cubensis]|uniref:26S proteasome non-ATPase regulatory subunit 8 n=2 Tax=Psilocybe cubensis TaxID=181762 RepID=A0ACB8H4R0_PSICU|nr:26S proteasome non-ATPase regulatory subunit 8 [Psilocybe cubensis]KAH9482836.1 26S proteasome non-ATPase regulatory subunit 8 [Psilocybe cubensis]